VPAAAPAGMQSKVVQLQLVNRFEFVQQAVDVVTRHKVHIADVAHLFVH
jgi:hypothetical protein